MAFLQPVECRFMVFLIWLLKEMGPYYVILGLCGLYTTEANSLVSSSIPQLFIGCPLCTGTGLGM